MVTKRYGKQDRRIFEYHIRLRWYRDIFSALLPVDVDVDTVRAHTYTYIMELIEIIFLLDNSSDCMPAIYCQFLQDIDDPPIYSWGFVVLACIYCNLCKGVMIDNTSGFHTLNPKLDQIFRVWRSGSR